MTNFIGIKNSMRLNALLVFLFLFVFNGWSQECANNRDLKKLKHFVS